MKSQGCNGAFGIELRISELNLFNCLIVGPTSPCSAHFNKASYPSWMSTKSYQLLLFKNPNPPCLQIFHFKHCNMGKWFKLLL